MRWPRLGNPLFSPAILIARRLAVLVCAIVFIAGYLRRWPRLPWAMAAIYGAMATICAIETVGFLVHAARFWAMAAEYIAYAAILTFLFRAEPMRQRFARR